MAGRLSDKDVKFLGGPGQISDQDVRLMGKAQIGGKPKRKFVPGEIYSAKGKTGRS